MVLLSGMNEVDIFVRIVFFGVSRELYSCRTTAKHNDIVRLLDLSL